MLQSACDGSAQASAVLCSMFWHFNVCLYKSTVQVIISIINHDIIGLLHKYYIHTYQINQIISMSFSQCHFICFWLIHSAGWGGEFLAFLVLGQCHSPTFCLLSFRTHHTFTDACGCKPKCKNARIFSFFPRTLRNLVGAILDVLWGPRRVGIRSRLEHTSSEQKSCPS